MTFQEVASILQAEVHSGTAKLSGTVRSGYASDLLSEVMAGAKEGQLWFTVQTHPNVAAVALLINIGAIVITGGHQPDPVTVDKAVAEGLIIMSTSYPTYDAIRALYKAGF